MLLLCSDDKTVAPENSFMYYDALRKNGVDAQLYVFPYGGHGCGFTTSEFGRDLIGPYRKVFSMPSALGSENSGSKTRTLRKRHI